MDSLRRMPVHVLIMLTMLFGLEMTFSGNQAWADRASCDQIKMACKNAGFVLGGGAREGLLLACFQPIVQGTPQPKLASRPLPSVSPQVVNACRTGNDSAPVAAPASAPLEPAADGQTVYDPNLSVTWLADANLAGRQTFGVPNINKDGSMDYATAVQWVNAMNHLDHGAGYLGHNNWSFPPRQPKTRPARARDATANRSGSIVRAARWAPCITVRWVFMSRTRPFSSPPIRSAHSTISSPTYTGPGLQPPIRSKDL